MAQQFSDIIPGTLAAGTETPEGVIVRSSLTAYQMADGRWVPFQRVHGRPEPVMPLVRLG